MCYHFEPTKLTTICKITAILRDTLLFTLLEMWESIMKLWTCFSALVSSSFLATTATTRTVQPAPCKSHK